VKRFPNAVDQVLDISYQIVVFGDWKRDSRDVSFLKGIGSDHSSGNLTRDTDDWRGIKHRGGNSGYKVGGTGPTGGYSNSNLSGSTGVAIGHMCCPLLMSYKDVMNLWILGHRVIGRKYCSTRVAKNQVDTFPDQAFP